MASGGKQKRKHQIWGETKEDLIPVKVFCRQTSHVGFSEDDIKSVAYKPCGAKKILKSDIHFYSSLHIKDVSQEIAALQSLKTVLLPLEKMEFTKRRRQIHWRIEEDLPLHTLSGQIMLAFMSGLKDTDGKSAIQMLISQMLQSLRGVRNELLVKMTGSSSHVSRYSTSYELVNLMEETTSSSDEGIVIKGSEKPACSTPITRPLVSPDTSHSSNDSGECQAPELSTADLLVYSQPLVDKPIKTKLVVSLKRHVKITDDILKQLLSRIPYQTGHIFGLEINTARATLYSVNVISEELVHIYRHNPFEFTFFDEVTGKSIFNIDSFWKMVLAIGHVLQD